jgi:GTP-binding protein
MKALNFQKAHFTVGAMQLKQLPNDTGVEVAFAGRSNAGKSSALNTLTRQKSLARTSKTPGRTQQINVFELESDMRLIDLPGYGYAKVSEQVKRQWQHTLSRYLEQRQSLQGLVLLMDSRHPLKDLDMNLVQWCVTCELPCHVLLTKADKLNQSEQSQVLALVKQTFGTAVSVQLFSAIKKMGLEQLEQQLIQWFNKHD